jgi:CO dehydrogenase/acetyl-CoA synthase beta subunit
MPITTNIVSSNPAQVRCTQYNIYVIKFIHDLQQVGGFLRVLWFPSQLKLTATI